jgi:hypothetical protein
MLTYVVASKCYRNRCISKKYETAHSFKLYVSFKTVPLRSYTQLRETVKVLETFRETILWNLFQLFLCILSDVNNITKAQSLQCLFQARENSKSAAASLGEYEGCSNIVTLLFATKSLNETDRCAAALLWRGNRLFALHFSGRLLLTASLRRQMMSLYILLFTICPSRMNS